MKKILIILLIYISNTALGQNEFNTLDSTLTRICLNSEFNGIILIGNQDSIIFSKAYGYADLEKKTKIDLNTQFYIASISKQFTATAILLLLENGTLKLEQPVKELLNKFPYDRVTIHHLLSNTSGIPGYIDYFAENWNKRKQATTDNVMAFIYNEKPKLNFESGSKFQYSNTNYVILAKIIETVSNQSYPSFLHSHIFEPCGLGHTYASYKPFFTKQDKNVAIGYVPEGETLLNVELSTADYIDRVNYLSGIQGDGSVVTSIGDLFQWHKALISNKVLTKATTELLFKPTTLKDGSQSYYGYGWYSDGEIADHTGSWPGYQSRIIRNLKTGVVGISLKNVEINNWNWIREFDKHIKQ